MTDLTMRHNVSTKPTNESRSFSDLDMLSTFETSGVNALAMQVPTRYAVRQVLDQELQKTLKLRETAAAQNRFKAGGGDAQDLDSNDKENDGPITGDGKPAVKEIVTAHKKDFFGRVIIEKTILPLGGGDGNGRDRRPAKSVNKVWVTYHEGLNNAVRKPLSLEEFMKGF